MPEMKERENRFRTPCGSPFVPIFEMNEKGEVVDSGKRHNLYEEIQSYKDSVELDKIIARATISGETFLAPEKAYGDATVLPKDPLEAFNMSKQAQSFLKSLSDADRDKLEKDGFDSLISAKIAELQQKKADSQKVEVVKDE